jgi:predicted Zn-dependent protease with MMP-like domain
MNGNRLEANEIAVVRAVHRTKLVTHFSEYLPPFDVTSVVHRMLESVPEEYLNALNAVVLTSTDCLSRERLKSKTKSRRRKVEIAQVLGLYHPAWRGETAWVEIFVDKTLRNSTKGWFKPPFEREMLLASVLFHEIGHHIHATRRPEFREREDVAESWKEKLTSRYFQEKYPWMIVLVYLMRFFRRLFRSR